jgi:DNA polymerase III epsilon subunit-like protein
MSTSARLEAISTARRWIDQRPVYLDTETTGIGSGAEIIEVGVIDFDGRVLVDTMVRPRGGMEPAAEQLHGISLDSLQSAPDWGEVWPGVEAVLSGRWVGIYNSEFDLRLLRQTHQKNWLKWTGEPGAGSFCIMKLYARFRGDWDRKRGSYRWYSLDVAGQSSGIRLPNAHRAIADARLARAVLHQIAGLSLGEGGSTTEG